MRADNCAENNTRIENVAVAGVGEEIVVVVFCLLRIHRSAGKVAKQYDECMTNKNILKIICCFCVI